MVDGEDSALQGPAPAATTRVEEIVEAAEKAASGIIDDAEAQARIYLEEARARADRIAAQRTQEMAALADTLLERAEAVKRQSDELLRVLDRAKLQAEEMLRPEPPAPLAPQPYPEPQPPPPVREAPPIDQAPVHRLKPVGQPQGPSEGARLLATQMAVAGSSRFEIESRLQNEFGIGDAGPMLDAILGRED